MLGVLRPPGEKILFFVFLLGIMVPSEAIAALCSLTLRALGLIDTIWRSRCRLRSRWRLERVLDEGVPMWMALIEAARLDGAGSPNTDFYFVARLAGGGDAGGAHVCGRE